MFHSPIVCPKNAKNHNFHSSLKMFNDWSVFTCIGPNSCAIRSNLWLLRPLSIWMEVTLRSSPWRLRKYLTRPDFSICIQATPRASEDAEAAGEVASEPERELSYFRSQGSCWETQQQQKMSFPVENVTIFAPKSYVLLDVATSSSMVDRTESNMSQVNLGTMYPETWL